MLRDEDLTWIGVCAAVRAKLERDRRRAYTRHGLTWDKVKPTQVTISYQVPKRCAELNLGGKWGLRPLRHTTPPVVNSETGMMSCRATFDLEELDAWIETCYQKWRDRNRQPTQPDEAQEECQRLIAKHHANPRALNRYVRTARNTRSKRT